MEEFRRFFLRGLAAIVPTLVTIAILAWSYRLLNDHVGVYITNGMLSLCSWISPQPAPWLVDEDTDPLIYGEPLDEWDAQGDRLTVEYKAIHHPALTDRTLKSELRKRAERHRESALWRIAFAKYKLHLLGFLAAIILVYFIGIFLASFIGRQAWRATEQLLLKIPLVNAIYPSIKQVTDFLLSERKVEFSGVVAVQYPRRGIWSIGLSTGGPIRAVQAQVADNLVSVFIPSSPTPVTGYVVQVPREDVIELPLSIEEALRYTISGGVIKPSDQLAAVKIAPGGPSGPALTGHPEQDT